MHKYSPFWKYTCCGSDLILLEDHDNSFPVHTDTIAIGIEQFCSRQLGIGASGLLVLRRAEGGRFALFSFDAQGNEMPCSGSALFCAAKHIGKKEVEIVAEPGLWCIREMGDGEYSLWLPPMRKVQVQQEVPGVPARVHIAEAHKRHAVFFPPLSENFPRESLVKSMQAHVHIVDKWENACAVICPDIGAPRSSLEIEAVSAIASVCYWLHKEKGPFTVQFRESSFKTRLHFAKMNKEQCPIEKIQISGSPQFIYKGLGEHYENWNTEGNQKPRIPSGAYA